MGDQTPRHCGQTTTNRATDGGTDADDQRRYVCLDCGAVSGTFCTDCGGCGGGHFQTYQSDSRPRRRVRDRVLGLVTRLTATVHPYIPR